MNTTSLIYDSFIKGKNVDQQIKSVIIDKYIIPISNYSNVIDMFKRKYKYSMTDKVINAIQQGDVVLAELPETVTVPAIFPVWLNKSGSDIRAIVNITPYKNLTFSADGFDGNTTLLFSLIQTGVLFRDITLNSAIYENNSKIVGLSMKIYGTLFLKVLDKLHSINLNIRTLESVRCKVHMFFLSEHYGKEYSPTNEKLALSQINEMFKDNSDFEEIATKDLNGFIDYLAANVDTLRKLNMRTFVDGWMSLFGTNSVLAIELYSYFISTIVGYSVLGSSLVKTPIIEKTATVTDIVTLYNEIAAKIQ